jgi:hypothetical protein
LISTNMTHKNKMTEDAVRRDEVGLAWHDIKQQSLFSKKTSPIYSLKMPFTTTSSSRSNVNEVSTPLLGKRPQHESDDDQGCIPRSSLSLAIVYDEEEEESCQKAAEDEKQWTNILSVTSVVLPALLFFQFGTAFFIYPVEANTGLQQWIMVNCIILVMLLGVTIAALYRQTVQNFQITCWVATVALMATFLVLVSCGQVVPALLLLLNSMLCMAVFVAVSSIRFLAVIKSKASLEEDHAYAAYVV